MYKYLSIVLIIVFIIIGCKEDTTTEPEIIASTDPALVGTWELTECKLNGNITSSENFSDCPVKLEFSESGIGLCWKEEYGSAIGCKSFSWSTTNSELTIHEENEYPFISTYVIVGETCTLSYVENGDIELVYKK